MKRFLSDTNGNTSLFAVFIAAVICTLAVIVYSAMMIYSNFQTARTELERAGIITIDTNMLNPNVRDLELNIPQEALADLESNFTASGLIKESEDVWQRFNNDKLVYEFRDLNVSVHNECLDISGCFIMPLPWSFGDQMEVTMPVTTRAKVIYLD